MLLQRIRRRGTAPLFGLLIILPMVIAVTSALTTAAAETATHAPRTLTVLVDGGRDITVLEGFFPQNLRVRVGDTVS